MLKRHPLYYIRHANLYLKRFLLPLLPPHQPDFLIIGAQKAATTSVYNYLNQLSGFVGSSNKEVYYFDKEINYGKDIRWYHNYFKSLSFGSNLFFEATPNYLYYPWVAKNIYDYNPHMKLVVILRDPIARAFSAWNMYKNFYDKREVYRLQRGLQPGEKNYIYEYLFMNREVFPSFEESINLELNLIESDPSILEPSLLRRGLYSQQLQEYYKYFGTEQIYCIGYRDLIQDPLVVVGKLYEWLKGDEITNIKFKADKRNARSYSTIIPGHLREQLNVFYADEYNRLISLIGNPLNW
jgi:hypothetical protein